MPTLAEIARVLAVPVPGAKGDVEIAGLAILEEAGGSELSFLGADRYLPQFLASKAAAFLVGRRVKLPADHGRVVLIVEDADLGMARVAEMFAPAVPRPAVGI